MDKPKAPRDMTVPEFVALLKKRVENGELKQPFNYNDICGISLEEAPSLFTPDQLAWMREEQRNGYNYAAKDANGRVYIYGNKPTQSERFPSWRAGSGPYYACRDKSFLSDMLSWDDKEPLCFADYAPL